MKIHFITYGTDNYKETIDRLLQQARNFGCFDTINSYGPADLPEDFKDSHSKILNIKKGGGYWIWRSMIFKKVIDSINDNDIIIFLDAGCTINIHGKNRFFEYIDKINSSRCGILSFPVVNHNEKYWTIKEIFNHYHMQIDDSEQLCGGIIIVKKNNHGKQFIDEFVKITISNPELFTDNYNYTDQIEGFIENRHDQSISSIIRKKIGTLIVNDNTDFYNKNIPFWASRIRHINNIKTKKKLYLYR